jgi:general secretion pathway protein G
MPTNYRRHGRHRLGFTLIELLLVLMILVVLGAMAIGMFTGTQERALKDAAKGQIGIFDHQIELYKLHMRTVPGALEDLIQQPSGDEASSNWEGPYIKASKLPDDPWGKPYRYSAQGKRNANGYDIWSVGPDGQDGTDDDIGNWEG